MRLMSLPLKNITGNIGRSITFGSFLFFALIISIFIICFSMTTKDNFEDSLIDNFTGHIRILPAGSGEEGSEREDSARGNIEYLNYADIKNITAILEVNGIRDYVKCVRHSAVFISDSGKQGAATIGTDFKSTRYRRCFRLTSGRYPDPENPGEVLISESLAGNLKVAPGDVIGAFSQTKEGYTADIALTVAGTGVRTKTISMSLPLAYMDLKNACVLKGIHETDATDIIIYLEKKEEIPDSGNKLNAAFSSAGLGDRIRLSTWESAGKDIKQFFDIFLVIAYSTIVILMFIISIIIINIVFMIGFERRQETGTVRAIGFSKSRAFILLMSEIMIIAVIACVSGVIAGSVLILALGKTGITFSNPIWSGMAGEIFYIKYYFVKIIPSVIIIFAFTFLASLYASRRATSLSPVETLKEI